MTCSPSKHHRRSIRLKGYDYASPGAYFVTICTQGHECLWGEVVEGEIHLGDAGKMVQTHWINLPTRFPNVTLDEYVIMPNHLHSIIVIVEISLIDAPAMATTTVGATLVVAPDWAGTSPAPTDPANLPPTLGDIVGTFKSITTNEYIVGVRQLGWPPFDRLVWQRNYYEHVIRNEIELHAIRRYIRDNPLQWDLDRDNPANVHHLPLPATMTDYLADITQQQE